MNALLLLPLLLAATVRPADEPAAQAALAAAQPGDTVELPAGDLPLTQPLRPPSGVHLVGAPGSTRLVWRGAKPDVAIALNGVEDVEVASLTIDGELSGKLGQGIGGSNSRRLRLHHLVIRNLAKTGGWGPHGILFSGINPTCERGVTDTEISDCRFEHVGEGAQYGGAVRLAWGSNRNRVLRCTIDGTGRGGIFGDHSSDLVIRENRVTGSGGEGLGIEIWGGCPRSLIEDNRVDHWISNDSGDQVAIRRNLIAAADGSDKFLGIENIASHCVIRRNTVGAGQHIGLSVSNKAVKNTVLWADNEVRDCLQWGAQFQGETTGIARHYFLRCRFEGNRAGDARARYRQDSGHGFRTNGACHDFVFDHCAFDGNGGYGLQLGGGDIDRFSFLDCTIRGNRGAAVVGPGPGVTLEFLRTVVTGNRDDHLPEGKPFDTPAPELKLTGPDRARVGQEATFTVTPSGAEVLWDFDDGLPELEPTARHTWTKPGTYDLIVVVWDPHGRAAKAEQRVTVTP